MNEPDKKDCYLNQRNFSLSTSIDFFKSRRIFKIFLIEIALVMAIVISIYLGDFRSIESKYSPKYYINLEEEYDESGPNTLLRDTGKLQLRVAIAPITSPEISRVKYQDFVHFISNAVGREGRLILKTLMLK